MPSALRSAKADTSDEIRTLARHSGMKLMQEYALEHIRDGLTTLEEVQRVVPFAPINTHFLPFVPARAFGRPFCSARTAAETEMAVEIREKAIALALGSRKER